jgi:GDP-mannose 6-dehydrogenase
MERVSVFGLGYVGCVSAACLARDGHAVVGMDVSSSKVSRVNLGHATILEEGIEELVAQVVSAGRLRATEDVGLAIRESDISLVAVGTPSRRNGNIDLTYIRRVCREIGTALAAKPGWHAVVIRSTVLPGTIEDVVIPELESASGKRAGVDFGVASNPEFLREGSSIRDYDDPPFTIVGATDPATGDRVAALYGNRAPVHQVEIRVAESMKYACNAFHALKVGFANEIGSICKGLSIDSHKVMDLLCQDTKLNISTKYLQPGFAFGGSCLPKDLRAIVYRARERDIDTPLLSGLLESNHRQVERAFQMVQATKVRRVAILGLAFKAGTDDLRESPLVTLVEMLLGRGYQLTIFDRDVRKANITGANKEYVEQEIPHLWELMTASAESAVADAELVIIGNPSSEFRPVRAQLRADQRVLDLARLDPTWSTDGTGYEGFAW